MIYLISSHITIEEGFVQPNTQRLRLVNMIKTRHFSLLLIFSITLLGCSKAKSKKWLVADIHVTDFDTGQGIQSSVQFRYVQSSMFGASPAQFEDLGQTDENGNIHIEHSIGKNYHGMELHIYPSGPYYWSIFDHFPKKISVYASSKNTHNVTVQAIYEFSLSVHNSNCTGPSDSLWITTDHGYGPSTFVMSGCVDSTLGVGKAFTHSEVIKWKSKKNSVLDSGILSPNYMYDQITPVLLEY